MVGFSTRDELEIVDTHCDIGLRVPDVCTMGNTEAGAFQFPAEMAAQGLLEFEAKCGVKHIFRSVRGVVVGITT